jgi:uncharacterized membrane protein YeiB
MDFFRRQNKKTLLWLTLLFAVALLSVQSIGLHVHELDHGSDHQNYIHAADTVADDHTHLTKVHSAHDSTHSEHHDDVSEIDISPDGFLKNLTTVFAIALVVYLLAVVMFSVSRLMVFRQRQNYPLYKYFVLSPPLRAPPLH